MMTGDWVDELPTNATEGDWVWLKGAKEGHWTKETFINGTWQMTGGMAVPYIPKFFTDASLASSKQ